MLRIRNDMPVILISRCIYRPRPLGEGDRLSERLEKWAYNNVVRNVS